MAKQEIDVMIISTESIKPSSPTPPHLKTFKLSLFDQFFSSSQYPYLLAFYPSVDDYDRRVRDLKSSLSKTLTRFYHLAGRINENEPLIDCTDEGADFIETRVSCNLSDVLKHPDLDTLFRLLPTEVASVQGADAILLVQTNLFECGGIAVCVSLSHKVADACTIGLFVKEWAAMARGAGGILVAPDITAVASRFPADSAVKPYSKLFVNTKSYKTRRFVFNLNSINALKTKITSVGLQRPTRVEVITGHIWLSTLKSNLRNGTKIGLHVLQPMNLRKRIDPPMSKNSFGNLTGISFAVAHECDDQVTDLESLVGEIRRGLQSANEWYAQNNANIFGTGRFKGNKSLFASLFEIEDERIMVTSGCKFGFYENSDFGWGEPVWVCLGNNVNKKINIVTLMDTKDGDGIEAWITLDEHVMDFLETDQDFLEFASLNPSVNLH